MDTVIRVLIVDDSALMRNLISRILQSDPGIEIAGTAMNGEFGLSKINRLKCDVVVLDLEMPVMNGIEFLKERKKREIKTPVIILSSIAKKGAQVTMEALSLGASDFILKPSGAESANIQDIGKELIELVRSYGRKYKESNLFEEKKEKSEPNDIINKPLPQTLTIDTPKITGKIEIIAIGISTGGPNALREILPSLDRNIPVPILIVQHMPAGFTFEFAKSLSKICKLDVKEASEGDLLNKPRIFIAPGDKHLLIEQKPLSRTIKLSDSTPINGHRPSVDVLFSSVANVYRNNCMAIIMTGMGKDGVKEIGTIYRLGGLTIAQDEASCIVAGMPREAVKNGYIHYVVSLNEMADTINKYALSI